MSSVYNKTHHPTSMFSTQSTILANMSWDALVLLCCLLCNARIPGANGMERRADWYVLGINVFEAIAYLGAGVLCLRNWRSPKIVSDRNAWLVIGIGMLSYFFREIFFCYTEIILKEELIVSLGDVFFVMTYLLLGIGMILAVTSRRLNLEIWQWIIVLAIGVGSVWVGLISNQPQGIIETQMPNWVGSLAPILNWFCIVSDVLLLIIATTLLLAFCSERVSSSWKMAAGAFPHDIADMWFQYATPWIPNYQSEKILEVFWVWSGVLFGMGTVLEYDASLHSSRRASGRKRV